LQKSSTIAIYVHHIILSPTVCSPLQDNQGCQTVQGNGDIEKQDRGVWNRRKLEHEAKNTDKAT